MNDVALVAVRWALYVDLGLLFGLPLFALYAPGGGRMVQRHLPMVAMVAGLACLALLLSALGFALQAAAMTGLPLTQPDLSMVAELFNGTSMGTALKARLVALLVLLLSIPFYRRQSRPAFIASTLAGAVALATLAWSGHGAAGEGEAGWLQLGADLIHLLAAGAWVGALAAFLALVLPRLATDDVAAEDMDQVTLAEEALRAAEAQEGTGLDRIATFVRTYVEGINSELGTCAVFSELNSLHPDDLKKVRKRQRMFGRRVMKLVTQGIADGSVVVEDVKSAAGWIISPPLMMPRVPEFWRDRSGAQLAAWYADFVRRALMPPRG